MPMYEFRCNKCRKKFEELVLSRDAAVRCPKCKKTDVARLMSAFSVKSSGASKAAPSSGKSCAGCRSKKCGSCG
jgi:putative FmdB family regulatory protein